MCGNLENSNKTDKNSTLKARHQNPQDTNQKNKKTHPYQAGGGTDISGRKQQQNAKDATMARLLV